MWYQFAVAGKHTGKAASNRMALLEELPRKESQSVESIDGASAATTCDGDAGSLSDKSSERCESEVAPLPPWVPQVQQSSAQVTVASAATTGYNDGTPNAFAAMMASLLHNSDTTAEQFASAQAPKKKRNDRQEGKIRQKGVERNRFTSGNLGQQDCFHHVKNISPLPCGRVQAQHDLRGEDATCDKWAPQYVFTSATWGQFCDAERKVETRKDCPLEVKSSKMTFAESAVLDHPQGLRAPPGLELQIPASMPPLPTRWALRTGL